MKNNVLYYSGENQKEKKLVIPHNLRESVLGLYHNHELSTVHMATDKMIQLFKKRFMWPGMTNDIKKWVGSCKKCCQHKRYQPHQHGLLTPIKSELPFQIIGADIAGPFKRSTGGNKYILVIIDYFTNWIEAIPLKTLTAEDTTRAFFKAIISRHGCPLKVITDHGTNFKSIFDIMCKSLNIKHAHSATMHHQTNGKSERFIQFMKNSLGTVLNSSMKNWDEMLDNVLFVYRISFSRVLNDSPFFLQYGRDAVLPQDLTIGHTKLQSDEENEDDYKVKFLQTLKIAYEKVL